MPTDTTDDGLGDPLPDELEELEEASAEFEPAPARAWERRPFAPGTSQIDVSHAYEVGGVRVVPGPVALRPDEVLLAVRRSDGHLDLAPRSRPLGPGETAVVAGGVQPRI
jgi:hypothetical protein